MFLGYAFARAMSQGGVNWEDVTHLGGVSGGQWFATTFAFSGEIFRKLTQPGTAGYTPLTDVVVEFGTAYGQNKAPIYKPNFGDMCSTTVNGLIAAANSSVQATPWSKKFMKDSVYSMLPALDWETYVKAMLGPWVPVNDSYAKAAGKRQGLSTASLVQGLSFASDFYMSTTPAMLSTVTATSALFPNGAPKDALLPMAHVMAAAGDPPGASLNGWHAPTLDSLKISTVNTFSYFSRPKVIKNLKLAPDPNIGATTAGSSAAVAMAASQNMMTKLMNVYAGTDYGSMVQSAYSTCQPLGLERLAVPLQLESSEGKQIQYRVADGGFTDNTALTATIGAMTTDCHTGKTLDCSKPFQVVSINGGHTGWGIDALFDKPGVTPSDGLVRGPDNFGLVMDEPTIQIFKEAPPATWTEFTSVTYNNRFTDHKPVKFTATYASLVATTVENAAYGVVGGYKVNLLFFAANVDDDDPRYNPIDVPPSWQFSFKEQYGPATEQMAAGAQPVIKKWMEGTL